MENERSKLAINIFFPIIILLFSILVIENIILMITTLIILSVYLNFSLFNNANDSFNIQITRTIYFSFLNISLLFAFSKLDLSIGILSGAKIGSVLGVLVNIGLISFLKNTYRIEENIYRFEGHKNSFKDTILLKVIVVGLGVYVSFFSSIYFLFPKFTYQYHLLISFFTVLTISVFYANRYNVFSKNDFSSKTNNYRFGLIAICLGLYLMWINMLSFLALLFVVAGLSYVQFVTMKEESSLQNRFFNSFILPSNLMLLSVTFFTLILGMSLSVSSLELVAPNEKMIYSNLQKVQSIINTEVDDLFNELKASNKLIDEVSPIIDIRLESVNTWYLKKEINLKGTFTYNYEDLFDFSIKHYNPGKYRLSDSDISKAIVQSFQLSVYNYLQSYFEDGTNVSINLFGAADAIPFSPNSGTVYRGEYGNRLEGYAYDYTNNGYIDIDISVNEKIDNYELAFLRSIGIYSYIEENMDILKFTDVGYYIGVQVEDKNSGPEFRKVQISITISDIKMN